MIQFSRFAIIKKENVEVLEAIQSWNSDISKNQASLLLKGILNVEFIVAIHCLKYIFAYTKPLSIVESTTWIASGT